MNKTRWTFVTAILANPLDGLPRRVWADWLDENGEKNAAQRQREYAGLIERGQILGRHVKRNHFFMYSLTKKGDARRLLIKPDGEINIEEYPLLIEVVRDLAIRYANYQRVKQNNHTYRADYVMDNIIWVAKPLLLNACEVAGIPVTL